MPAFIPEHDPTRDVCDALGLVGHHAQATEDAQPGHAHDPPTLSPTELDGLRRAVRELPGCSAYADDIVHMFDELPPAMAAMLRALLPDSGSGPSALGDTPSTKPRS